MREKIILGIDPGTTIMGYGLIKVLNNNMSFMLLNELNLKKLGASSAAPPWYFFGWQFIP